MLSSKSEFEKELEYWTAHSKVHWSELSHHEGASSSEGTGSCSGESGIGSEDQSGVDHSQYFEELQRDAIWGGFCSAVKDVVLGKKLGEGAQAVIYEAEKVTFATELSESEREAGIRRGYVVKVMKSSYALQDLQRQWPRGLATSKGITLTSEPIYGTLVKDHAIGRKKFGFVMAKRWGDLRRLIDLRMECNSTQGPPFSTPQARLIICMIVAEMSDLHKIGIVHRDLKAANVLLNSFIDRENFDQNFDLVTSNDMSGFVFPFVADWECSVGVVGTGFWRAPEVLQQLKDGTPTSKLVFTKEMDVYSFGMTCYEIVTGKVPFEDLPFNEGRDAILDGDRPELPHDMDPIIKLIITRCWHSDPSNRPSFVDLIAMLSKDEREWIFC